MKHRHGWQACLLTQYVAGGADGADSCAFDAYRRPAAGFRYDGDTGSLRTADGTQLCRDNLRRYCLWARYRFRWSDLILLC